MKTVTITAIVGALVALPFIFSRRKPEAIPVTIKSNNNGRDLEANLRYDVDDFLME